MQPNRQGAVMQRRRTFLSRVPLAVAGMMTACRARGSAAESSPAAASGGTSGPAPLLGKIPSTAKTLTWTPEHKDLVYTFGGNAPKHRIVPGTRIVSWTEDCFDGLVKTAGDLPSRVMPPGHDNPQSGPFYVEGAEPGDTLAVHLLKVEPARSYGVSSFAPGFGALV